MHTFTLLSGPDNRIGQASSKKTKCNRMKTDEKYANTSSSGSSGKGNDNGNNDGSSKRSLSEYKKTTSATTTTATMTTTATKMNKIKLSSPLSPCKIEREFSISVNILYKDICIHRTDVSQCSYAVRRRLLHAFGV